MVRKLIGYLGIGLGALGITIGSYFSTTKLSYPNVYLGISKEQLPYYNIRCWDNCYIGENCQLGRVEIKIDGEVVINSDGPFSKGNFWDSPGPVSEFLIPAREGTHLVRVEVTDIEGKEKVKEKTFGLGE